MYVVNKFQHLKKHAELKKKTLRINYSWYGNFNVAYNSPQY